MTLYKSPYTEWANQIDILMKRNLELLSACSKAQVWFENHADDLLMLGIPIHDSATYIGNLLTVALQDYQDAMESE